MAIGGLVLGFLFALFASPAAADAIHGCGGFIEVRIPDPIHVREFLVLLIVLTWPICFLACFIDELVVVLAGELAIG